MAGRDPLLVWYTETEPILSAEERDRIIVRLRTHRYQIDAESKRFWSKIPERPPAENPPGRHRAFLERFREWRHEGYNAKRLPRPG